MIIGITGGIGAGKSTLSKLLQNNGYLVYNTDIEAKRLQNEDDNLKQQIISLFGEQIYVDDKLNRKKLAEIVFEDPEALRKISAVVHPVVQADFERWKSQFPDKKLLFVESAILFEGKFHQLIDKVILVTAPEEIRIERVLTRDEFTRDEIIARIKNQTPDVDKIPKSDLVIDTRNGMPENVLELIKVWQH